MKRFISVGVRPELSLHEPSRYRSWRTSSGTAAASVCRSVSIQVTTCPRASQRARTIRATSRVLPLSEV